MATMTDAPRGAAAAPGSEYQQRQPMRPRSKSAFSITSDKSQTSRRSTSGKEQFRESHDEKRKLAFSNTTKANPNAAMNELQPIAQQLEKATIASLRGSQYLDMHGTPITDPDFSNPTRRRTERPLETIMSFEAAIDRDYRKQRDAAREAARQSYVDNGASQDNSGYDSRRSSYWGGGEYVGNGYYNQPQAQRSGHLGAPPSRNKYGARMNSDSNVRYNYGNNGYPYSTPGYGQTYDTINTGVSNGSASDQWHNSTDPSSDNSSIERMKAEHHESHGHPTPQREPISEDGRYTYSNGPGYNPAYMSGGTNGGPSGQSGYFGHQHVNNGAPAPPPKVMQGGPVQPPAARQPIRLDPSARQDAIPGGTRPAAPEKRKSWLKRTFSKK